MTTRLKAFIVVLDHDMREDDAEHVINAIKMLRCVQEVKPLPANGYDDFVIRSRTMQEVQDDLRGLMQKWNKP